MCQQSNQSPGIPRLSECCRGASASPHKDQRVKFYWPIVCKQFWNETVNTFYASTTFIVEGSIDLYILASSHQRSVRSMRNLELRLGFGIKHHNRIWSPKRCASVIKKFESLQSLTLLVGFVVQDDTNYTGVCFAFGDDGNGPVTRASRLEGSQWQEENNWFPVFLRSFQVHQLQVERTRVAIFDRQRKKEAAGYHEKDPRKKHADYEQRRDEEIQVSRKLELEASMRAVLLGQNISDLFPNRAAEDKQLLDEFAAQEKRRLES